MIEERLTIPGRTRNSFFLMIAIGLVLLIAGIILMHFGIGAGHHEEGGHAAAAAEGGHHAITWYNRLMTNLWLNNVYFTGAALVGTFFLAVQYVAYAGWSVMVKRILEALSAYLPVGGLVMLAVFFLGQHQ